MRLLRSNSSGCLKNPNASRGLRLLAGRPRLGFRHRFTACFADSEQNLPLNWCNREIPATHHGDWEPLFSRTFRCCRKRHFQERKPWDARRAIVSISIRWCLTALLLRGSSTPWKILRNPSMSCVMSLLFVVVSADVWQNPTERKNGKFSKRKPWTYWHYKRRRSAPTPESLCAQAGAKPTPSRRDARIERNCRSQEIRRENGEHRRHRQSGLECRCSAVHFR